ncbi:MAG: HAMP domain-containing sensor histidine kinase [Bdellovibrionota bacterium]
MFSKLSLRLRLALLFVLIFGTTSILFNVYTFNFMIEVLQNDFDNALFNYSVDVSEGIELGRNEALELIPINLNQGKILPFPLGQALIQIRHVSGSVLARLTQFQQVDFPYKKAFEAFAKGEDSYYRTINLDSTFPDAEAHSYRLLTIPLDNNPQPQLALQIAVPLILMENQIDSRLNLFRFGIPIVLLLAALGGLFVSGRALAPVKEIMTTAQNISVRDLSQRIAIPKNKDEIRGLALTLNHMLDRIENSFASQDRFIADASHQLLTPLTIMRAEVELKSRTADKNLSDFFKNQLTEIDHLSRIIKDMLFLAQVDSGVENLKYVSIPADEVLTDVLSSMDRAFKNKRIEPHVRLYNSENRREILCDIDLMKHLLTNLIENGIKYSAEASILLLEVYWKIDSTEIRITDQGPGIPADVRENIFQRFTRGRRHETQVKGYGLGLSIAKKIAELHKAELFFEDAQPHGTVFHLIIPAEPTASKTSQS